MCGAVTIPGVELELATVRLHDRTGDDLGTCELVGNRSAKVLADTYPHVLMNERELDYASVIAERLPTLTEPVLARRRGQGLRPVLTPVPRSLPGSGRFAGSFKSRMGLSAPAPRIRGFVVAATR